MPQVFERAASSPLAAAVPEIQNATTFGEVIKVLQAIAEAAGDTDTAASVRGQMQYGLRKRGQKARQDINARARAIVARVDGDPGKLTDEERDVLMQYSGRGGIQGDNSLSEYYTPQPIAEGVWDMLAANGFENGNVLEPSTGAGVFMATKPAGVKVSGAEIDETSSAVSALLHPDDDVSQQSFEQLCASADDNTFDSVIGNVPFGDARGKWAKFDPEYQGIKEMERYFVTRAIDKVRHGGLVALIVPTNIISKRSKAFTKWRRDISRKAEFLGAHKLPSGTFGGANGNGTDTVVDVLIMRKHSRDLIDKIPDLSTDALKSAAVYWDTFISGRWFEREGKRFVHGEIVEGYRTEVQSSIDNAGLKRLMARKFSGRIDYALLDTAETITRNYRDGDRRVIGMQMHEMVAGEWQKIEAEDGVLADGSLDAAMYGVDSVTALRGTLNDTPATALAVSFDQARNAATGRFHDDASQTVKNAVAIARNAKPGMQERLYRATLIGAEIGQYARRVSETGQADDAARERLQALVTAEVEQYGNPAKDAHLRGVSGPGANNVAAFARAMTKDGGFSDLLTGERTGERGQAYDTTDPVDVIRQVCVMDGAGPIPLTDADKLYTGTEPLTLEAVAKHDGIAITADGLVQPMEYFVSGNVVAKIAALERAIATEESPVVADRMRAQVDAINARRTFTDVDDIAFSMRDKWYDRSHIARFLRDSGHDGYYLDTETGEFDTLDDKPERFTKQLLNYLNGKAITSSKAEIAAEYKQQAKDLEEQYNVWVRQQDDIDTMVAQYNDVFNDYVPMEYDGSDLQLDNTADWITPHDYQAAAVRRLSDEGRGILAFDVGLGKSLSALSLAQYNAQKGRAKRTCVVVPKSVLENWYHETRQFHKSMDHVHFVGFTPKMKGGEPEREPVLDEEGTPRVGRNGEVQYRDVLSEDSAQVVLEKMADIPQTSKTLVVMSRERFGMIPLRPDTRESYADRMVERNLMSDSNAASLAQGEDVKLGRGGSYDDAKKTERYQEKYNDDGTQKKDAYPFYEDMGFDSVIVDEGHDYKNTYQAGGETQRLAYLPTPAPSKRSVDMAVKMDHLRTNNNGAGPVMLTATPVTNSPVEIYNMLSHIVPAEFFERMGISNVDDFVQHFCSIEQVSRVKLSGKVTVEDGVAGFQNLDALRNLFHRFTNMKTAEDVNDDDNSLNMPDSTEVHASVEMTTAQADIYEQLRQEADSINQKMAVADEDGMLSFEEARPVFAIIRDMDRITTDMDLYLGTMTFTVPEKHKAALKALVADLPATVKRRLKDEETGETEMVDVALEETFSLNESGDPLVLTVSEHYEVEVVKRLKRMGIPEKDVAHPVMPKYAKLLDNLRREHENGGKQLVFTEEKSQHDKLKRIITHHLPIEASEIGIINADTASGDKLEKISGAYNTGKSRIIIANKKAEVGVNLQKGTTAIHHLTLPWTPASIQQRNGRGVRQGNTSSNVDVIYYMGKGSFDGYRLESLKRKSTWIKDLFYGDAATAANANAGSEEDMAVMLAANPEEAKARIAEQRKRQEDAQRARANQRAIIDLSNLRKHKDFLADYESAERRATVNAEERGRDPEIARERMQQRRDKAQADVRQIEARLTADQDKGRIDVDAKRLIHGGNYLTTLSGQVIEEGQIMQRSERSLWRVESLNAKAATVTLMPIKSKPRDMERLNLSVKRLGSYKAIQLTEEGIARHILQTDYDIRYESLSGLAVTDALLAELGKSILPRMSAGGLVMQDAQGELVIASRSGATDVDGHVAAPRLSDKSWRDRLAAAGLKAYRNSDTLRTNGFLKTLLGENWLAEAMQAFGNPPPDDVLTASITETLEAKLTDLRDKTIHDTLEPVEEAIKGGGLTEPSAAQARINGPYRMYANEYGIAAGVAESVGRDLRAAEYDVNADTIKAAVRRQAGSYATLLGNFISEQEERLLTLLQAKRDEAEAEAEAEREAARVRMEAMGAVMPDNVAEFFDDLGITAKLNATETTWQHKGGGRRKPRGAETTSGPGERFMLFDPAGRGGALATALAGNRVLQSELSAVWTIFDGDLWWHMPTDGLDYDTLMGAF